MVDSRRIALDLIGPIYDAADDPALWPAALEQLRLAMRANGAVIGVLGDTGGPESRFIGVGSNRNAATDVATFQNRYAESDPLNIALRQQTPLVPALSHAIMPVEEFFESEIYREFYSRFDGAYGIGMVLLREAQCYSGITFFRGRDEQPFADGSIELLELLGPHLQRAFQFQHRLAEVEGRWDAAGDVLNRLSMGVVIVDAERRVVFANERALAFTSTEGSAILLSGDRIAAVRAEDSRTLWRLIDGALDTSAGIVAEPGGPLHLDDDRGGAVAVLVAPLHRRSRWPGWNKPMAAVFISDPNLPPETPADVLTRLYGLTPSEAEVAARLVRGMTLLEVASDLFITENTARRHLTHVFAKTGTRRQTDLVRLLSTGPAALRA
jgi:DNA-binding CsgD family transcriptional regulator/PAS domain-containing protein